ncbi:hypothetical protein DY037_08490, partial [Apilactobacillus micheneri]|uniref:hypothetical protein n=2 Tax=Apilactobacillus TaxID=2767877 RepID=UPI0011287C32
MLETNIKIDKDFVNYYKNLERNVENQNFRLAKTNLNNMERIFIKYNGIKLNMSTFNIVSSRKYDYKPVDNQINYMKKACIDG